MTQNTSHAVMAQRHEPDDSRDDYPSPPWATRALCEKVIAPLLPWNENLGAVWEPSCNRGYMSRALLEYTDIVFATDICDYGVPGVMDAVQDFLLPNAAAPWPVDFIITNPPFRLAEQFIAQARNIARVGCAMLVRSSFLEGVGRYNNLYSTHPPTVIAIFSERVPMVKGRCDPDASTATSYSWLVWIHGKVPQPFQWIPPCRRQLERAGDYPDAAVDAFTNGDT
jgi:hypothetical protein